MSIDEDIAGIATKEGNRLQGRPGFMRRLLAYALTAVVLVLGVMFSAVVVFVLALVGLLAAGYLWWEMRRLKKAGSWVDEQDIGQATEETEVYVYEHAQSGRVIEGEVEVIRETEPGHRIEN